MLVENEHTPIKFPTAAKPIAARSAAKKILGSAGVRSEIRYFGRAFVAFFPVSVPCVEIQLFGRLVGFISTYPGTSPTSL